MKIRVQQLNSTIGDITGNTAAINKAIGNAESNGIDLLLLPELAVCGYSPLDLLERPAFLNSIYEANEQIANHTNKTAVIFGTVTPNEAEAGRQIFNSAIFACEGEIKAEIHKTLLPTYSVYDELRYFEPNKTFECIEFKGRKVGVTICEDIWCNFGNYFLTYETNPVQELADLGAEAIFNLSATPFDRHKTDTRVWMLRDQIERVNLPVFYANQIGGNTDLISDGDSMVMNNSGEIIARAALFKEAFADVEWDKDNELKNLGNPSPKIPSKNEQIFQALQLGLSDYLRKSGAGDKVIIGLSGGLDSTLVACIAAEALGTENVTCVAMPSPYSSTESVTDSQKLTDNLGVKLEEIAIEGIYEEYLKALKPLFEDTSFGTAEENLQARIRGMLLMAISNKFGGLVLNTGNKSELAVGYCTLYGDMCGAIGIISDLYKTDVYELAEWLNKDYYKKEVIPKSILEKPPSAELRPGQEDSDSLPPYKVLDPILKLYIEERKSLNEIVEKGYEEAVVDKIIKRIQQSEYKRYQAPPGLKVGSTSFGPGIRQPIVHK